MTCVRCQARDPTQFALLRNATVSNGQIVCDLPCGFGAESGSWQFVAVAAGYQPRAVSVQAGYAVFSGGCRRETTRAR